jgi:hypothetical protein
LIAVCRIKNALRHRIARLSTDERTEATGGSTIAAYELQLPARSQRVGAHEAGHG